MTVKKDTLRLLLTWKCNRKCSYCCNKLPEVQARIRPATPVDLYAHGYDNVCISGGEPLLHLNRVFKLLHNYGLRFKHVYLYTNGDYLNDKLARDLFDAGVAGINIGIHSPAPELHRTVPTLLGDPRVRLHVIAEHARYAPVRHWQSLGARVKFVPLNACDTPNEDILQLPDDFIF